MLFHFSTFLDADDLDELYDILILHSEMCEEYISELKKKNSKAEEKAQNAILHLEQLMQTRLNMEQRKAATLLIKILSG